MYIYMCTSMDHMVTAFSVYCDIWRGLHYIDAYISIYINVYTCTCMYIEVYMHKHIHIYSMDHMIAIFSLHSDIWRGRIFELLCSLLMP
jgi:hypothetical protein